MKEIYKGYTIEVEPDGNLMDDEDGNLIPDTEAWQYQIFEGTGTDANMEEIVDMESGDESEECALSNAKSWLDSFIERKENKICRIDMNQMAGISLLLLSTGTM